MYSGTTTVSAIPPSLKNPQGGVAGFGASLGVTALAFLAFPAVDNRFDEIACAVVGYTSELVAIDETGDACGHQADIGTADPRRSDRQPYPGSTWLIGIDDTNSVVGVHDGVHVAFSLVFGRSRRTASCRCRQ